VLRFCNLETVAGIHWSLFPKIHGQTYFEDCAHDFLLLFIVDWWEINGLFLRTFLPTPVPAIQSSKAFKWTCTIYARIDIILVDISFISSTHTTNLIILSFLHIYIHTTTVLYITIPNNSLPKNLPLKARQNKNHLESGAHIFLIMQYVFFVSGS